MKLKQMIAVLSSVAMLLCGCSSANAKDQTYSDTLYDTVVKVQILDPVNENVMSGLKSLCQKYNTMFSMYVEGSDFFMFAPDAPIFAVFIEQTSCPRHAGSCFL